MNKSPRLSSSNLMAYAGPAVPLAMLLFPIYMYLPPFYSQEVGLDLTTIGLIFALARVWDGLIDPVIGICSDRMKSRWGRRKPWLLIGMPGMVMTTYFLCMPSAGVGAFYLFVWIMLFYVSWTVIFIPYYTWGVELSSDYVERNKVTGFRETGTMLGLLLATGLPLIFLHENPDLGSVLRIFTWAVAILLPATISAATWKVGEEINTSTIEPAWWQGLSTLRCNGPFVRFLAGVSIMLIALAMVDSTILFIIADRFGLKDAFLQLIFVQFITAIALAPFLVKLSKKIQKHKLIIFSAALFSMSYVLMANFLPHGLWVTSLLFVALGVASSAFRIFPTSLVADTIDYGTFKTGHEQAGAYIAVYNLVYKLCMALGVAIAFPLLDYAGYTPGDNTYEEALPLVQIGLGIPASLLLIAILILWKYPITAKRHAIIRAAIDRRVTRHLGAKLQSGAPSRGFNHARTNS